MPEPEVVAVEEPAVVVPEIICNGCTAAEQETLEFFFEEGITDKHALAMIMGSIKQESRFQPSVCEGGLIDVLARMHTRWLWSYSVYV